MGGRTGIVKKKQAKKVKKRSLRKKSPAKKKIKNALHGL